MKDKLYWVCGSSSGIGLSVAKNLASKNASLVLMSRDGNKLQKTAEELTPLGKGVISTFIHDISTPPIQDKIKSVIGNRSLNGVFLNGGGPPAQAPEKIMWEDFECAHRLLFAGPGSLLLLLLNHMSAPSSIVALTSVAIKEPIGGLSLSAAYRSALIAWLKSLSDTFAHNGIRFNNVAPGYTRTERLTSLIEAGAQKQGISVDALEAQLKDNIPMKRIGSPEEIANACTFLLSEESSFITGQTLIVDGGQVRGY